VKSAVETMGPTRAKLTVEVPFEELKPSLDKAYKTIAQQINVPGFRMQARKKIGIALRSGPVGSALSADPAAPRAPTPRLRPGGVWREGSMMSSSLTDTVLDYGDQALLLQFDSTAEVLAWTGALREVAMPGVLDIVPAARTVLLKLDGPGRQSAIRRRLGKLSVAPDAVATAPDEPTVIDVVYDGADLAEVAELTGMTTAQVIDAHTANPWNVGFCGFAPGFAYLVGGDPRLAVPRRSEPRPSVPAGAVGLAGEFTGIYPRRSPGGWQLIGHTDAVLWDIDRPDPALLTPGMWVQFRAA